MACGRDNREFPTGCFSYGVLSSSSSSSLSTKLLLPLLPLLALVLPVFGAVCKGGRERGGEGTFEKKFMTFEEKFWTSKKFMTFEKKFMTFDVNS